MSGNVSILESIAAANDDAAAWQLMLAHRAAFIWTDDETLENPWNRIAESYGIDERMTVEPRNGHQQYVCGSSKRVIPMVHDRDDMLIVFPHTLAVTGAAHLELRYCRASAHSSDQAFAAAPPALWPALDSGPYAGNMKRQFLPISRDLAAFASGLSEPHAPPAWIDRLSPDGKLQLIVDTYEASNSHWVMCPAVIETETGEFRLQLGHPWSADSWKWTGDAVVELVVRKYPGNHEPSELVATIDLATRTARVGQSESVPLEKLVATLDAALTWIYGTAPPKLPPHERLLGRIRRLFGR